MYKEYFNSNVVNNYLKSLNISVEELDYEILELVYVFNKIGLTTEFSCCGHHSYEYPEIIFDKSVTDKQIIKVAETLLETNDFIGSFDKWVRNSHSVGNNEVMINWSFNIRWNIELGELERCRSIKNTVRFFAKQFNLNPDGEFDSKTKTIISREDDYSPGCDHWNDFSKYQPEGNSMCIVEYTKENYPEYPEYDIRFFENRDRCIYNWFDVISWRYLYE